MELEDNISDIVFSQAIEYALKKVGSPDLKLKPEQQSAIRIILGGGDVFIWLPTGFGKSVCFELLPFVYDHKLERVGTQTRSLVLVLSPLISLMVNQVTNLKLRGVSTAIISGSDKISKNLQATQKDLKTCSLLFSVPEAVLGHKWRDSIENPDVADRIVAIVIDEAHCVSKW